MSRGCREAGASAPSTLSHIPFSPTQEDLEQPAPSQEDKAAKAEEEVAEEVGAGLPENRGYPGNPASLPGSPEPSGKPCDLLQPPQPECEVPS